MVKEIESFNLDSLLEYALDAARSAGEEVMKIYHESYDIYTKKDESPVTKADLLANSIINDILSKTNFPILSEESEDDESRLESNCVWVVDPIDGTKGFINKDGDFAIQIGLVVDEEPVIGVVYLPVFDKMYYAIKGRGAYLLDGKGEDSKKRLYVKYEDSLEDSVIFVSKNHYSEEMKELIEDLKVKEVHHVGGVGVKLGLISEGKSVMDFKLTSQCSEWDLCGPQCILEEAGGYVYDVYGNPIHYNKRVPRISSGYVATSFTKKTELLQHLSPFIRKHFETSSN